MAKLVVKHHVDPPQDQKSSGPSIFIHLHPSSHPKTSKDIPTSGDCIHSTAAVLSFASVGNFASNWAPLCHGT